MNASHGDAGPALAAGKETVATLEPPGPALELQSNALPPQSAPRGPRPASRLARVRVTVYRATKTAFAVVLLAAAVLKARQFLFEPTVGDASGWYTRIHLGLVFLELTLGAFLLANWWPRTTRFVAIGLLGGFAWLNFNQASCGAGTCPCFGEVTVSPWASFGIDLGFLAGFVIPMPAALKASVYASSLVASRWALALVAASLGFVLFLGAGIGVPGSLESLLSGRPLTARFARYETGPGPAANSQKVVLWFRVTNHGDKSVRLIGGESTRGCFATRDLPKVVPPRGSVELPIIVSRWNDSPTQQHLAALFTDEPAQRRVPLAFTLSGRNSFTDVKSSLAQVLSSIASIRNSE